MPRQLELHGAELYLGAAIVEPYENTLILSNGYDARPIDDEELLWLVNGGYWAEEEKPRSDSLDRGSLS